MRVTSAALVALGRGVARLGSGRAALAAYRRVLGGEEATELRAAAFVAAVELAVELGDAAALGELAAAWRAVPGIWLDEIVALCLRLAARGKTAEAESVAGAEVARHRTARALYLWARLGGGADAVERLAQTIARAASEGAVHIVRAARVRRATLLATRWETLPEALAEAGAVELAGALPRERLAVALVLLRAPSRFVRATALGVLDELLAGDPPDAALAAHALAAAARYADDRAPVMTPLEADRLRALFGRPFALAQAPRARAVLAALEAIARATPEEHDAVLAAAESADPALGARNARVRDVIGGRFVPAGDRQDAGERVLEAAAALQNGQHARLAAGLRALADGAPVSRSLLGVVQAALLVEDAEVRAAALAIVGAHLAAPSPIAPPRGYAALARALSLAGAAELAAVARRAAAVAREPGAVEALGRELARAGWDLAARGEVDAAIARLREARAVS